MSLDDGLPDDMHRPFRAGPETLVLDDGTANRLLAGTLDPADAPPGYAPVAEILSAARRPVRAADLAGEGAALEAFRRAGVTGRRRRAGTLRLAALVTTAVLALGGVAAAASTGSLPGPAQSFAHDALNTVGVSVPAPSATRRTPAVPHARILTPTPRPVAPHPPRVRLAGPPPPSSSSSTTPHPTTPRPTAPHQSPRQGTREAALCRAYDSGWVGPTGGPQSAAAWRLLVSLAGGPANVPGYCRSVLG